MKRFMLISLLALSAFCLYSSEENQGLGLVEIIGLVEIRGMPSNYRTFNAEHYRNRQTLLVDNRKICSSLEKAIKAQAKINKLSNSLPRYSTGKDAVRAGVLTGGATLAGCAAWNAHNKSGIGSTATILTLGTALGVSLTVGLGYHMFGKEIDLITGFKRNLQKSLDELEETKKLVAELKEHQKLIGESVGHAIDVTEDILKQFPQLKNVSGDNAKLADIIKEVIKQSDRQTEVITQLILALPEKDIAKFTENIDPEIIKLEKGKASALKAYNKKAGLFGKKHSFNDIPHEWLTKNDFGDLVEIA